MKVAPELGKSIYREKDLISSDSDQDQDDKLRANISMQSQNNARKPIGRTDVYGEI